MIYESSPQPITWNKLYVSNASPENSSPKKALQKIARFSTQKIDPATGVSFREWFRPWISGNAYGNRRVPLIPVPFPFR